MGPVLAIRPVVQTLGGAAGHAGAALGGPPAGSSPGVGTMSEHGSRASPAFAAETPRPVAAPPGSARSAAQQGDLNHLVEVARERAEAAHRAYTMTMLALGQNPLNDPVP